MLLYLYIWLNFPYVHTKTNVWAFKKKKPFAEVRGRKAVHIERCFTKVVLENYFVVLTVVFPYCTAAVGVPAAVASF